MDFSAKPNIIKAPEEAVSQIRKDPSGWFKRNLVKIVIVVLVVAVVLEIVFGGMTLFSPNSTTNPNALAVPRINSLSDAVISLIPDKPSYKKGDQVVIDVKLFTGGYSTDSTDLVVKFDPRILQASTESAQAGNIYSEYPAVQVDNNQGLIGVSGITLPGNSSFLGVGSFAKLYFTALADGQAEVAVDFQKDATAESNVVLSGSTKDILGVVNNANVIISESAGVQNNQASESCTSFIQYCQTADGLAGTQVCSGGAIINGVCGYDKMNTTTCEVCKTE